MSGSALTVRQRLAAYAGLAKIQISAQTIYRSNYLVSLLGLLFKVYLLKEVWVAAYPHSRATMGHGQQISLSAQIAYSTLASVQYFVFNPWTLSGIPERVRNGQVAVDLARPVRYTAQMTFGQAGVMIAGLPFVIVALPFAILVGGAEAPASAGAGLGYAVSLVPAFLITLLTGSIVGITAFWTLETDGTSIIYRMVAQFFAGALVPLWFMPGWLETLASWLPFQATTYTPIAIYMGKSGSVVSTIGLQCVWVVVLWLILRLLAVRALRRVALQGG
ncbi:hypothetical protein BIV57_17795 [Mangrovactinospora gilvigrisea]|uniref:ABC transporter permease n=1 Tax=Mangrovactinospora gilvigrisea TaxID=1428644 RepID=A0A1J7BBY1_9ACTN|nr:ABC-2 family transporter protein [Mangrovactinospora gilvigrisea]OIV36142.1 hypothetical protein BIV57_17795 [Mangrovactinospora gilvigrisea]